MKTKECNLCEEGEAEFFHSACCQAHFEGVVKDGKQMIACEECGKVCGEVR